MEDVIIHSPGAIAGVPGDHAPGMYLIDWEERTVTFQGNKNVSQESPVKVIAELEVAKEPEIVPFFVIPPNTAVAV